MEIRARYFLIGLFVLAVLAAGVGFIYWLYNTGGLVERTAYRVSFNGSVSGLAAGSPVLFNGLQVGEVTGLSLSADDPGIVVARIAIDKRTPVRTDTHVGMDFRGLTGTAAIALNGGTLTASPPESTDGQPPMLVADPSAIKDMTASAREALTRLNNILGDNAEPLKSAISSIDTFAQALARNADKVDGILAGLEKMTGGGDKQEPTSYDLVAATDFPAIADLPAGQLLVAGPTATVALDTQRIMIKGVNGLVPAFEGTRWADSVPLLVQARLIDSFGNAGYPRVVSDANGGNGDFTLSTTVQAFEFDRSDTPTARVALVAKILDADGKVIDAKSFEAEAPVSAPDTAASAAMGIGTAFAKVATDLVVWSLASVHTAEATGGGDAKTGGDMPPMPPMPDMPPPPDADAPAGGDQPATTPAQ
jgi:phospholipid/cholesterol/gamma-HCH transport system substrate-binding protein